MELKKIKDEYSFSIYFQMVVFAFYTITLCFNIDPMCKLYSTYRLLFCFIVGNMGLIVFDVLHLYMFWKIVTLNNSKIVNNVSMSVDIIINLYGVWGFVLSTDKSVYVPGLILDGTSDQISYWIIIYITI